jgi:hypothetical protein
VLPFWWELVGAHGTTLYQCIMFHLCLNCFFLSFFLPSFLSFKIELDDQWCVYFQTEEVA